MSHICNVIGYAIFNQWNIYKLKSSVNFMSQTPHSYLKFIVCTAQNLRWFLNKEITEANI